MADKDLTLTDKDFEDFSLKDARAMYEAQLSTHRELKDCLEHMKMFHDSAGKLMAQFNRLSFWSRAWSNPWVFFLALIAAGFAGAAWVFILTLGV